MSFFNWTTSIYLPYAWYDCQFWVEQEKLANKSWMTASCSSNWALSPVYTIILNHIDKKSAKDTATNLTQNHRCRNYKQNLANRIQQFVKCQHINSINTFTSVLFYFTTEREEWSKKGRERGREKKISWASIHLFNPPDYHNGQD